MAGCDPNKPTHYYVVPQWGSIPDYGVALIGNQPPANVSVCPQPMERLTPDRELERKLLQRLVFEESRLSNALLQLGTVQDFVMRRTNYKSISFDRSCNNVVIFEGPYSPKAYLRNWKTKNDLTFVLWLTDVNQFCESTKHNIAVSRYDFVISEYPPPADFASLVDRVVEVCTPKFDFEWLTREFRKHYAQNHQLRGDELDVFLAGSSTPIRDDLMLPLCEAIRKHKLNSYFIYSGLPEVPAQFPFLRSGFPDSTRYLHPAENNFLTRISNCLIEITKSRPPHVVERFQKAVMYNKKYIGNNPELASSPFYNPRWMRIISSPEDVTPELIEWIRRKEAIDYSYDGRWEFQRTVVNCIEDLLAANATRSSRFRH